MHCKQARKLLIASLDRPQDAADQQAVHAHVHECQECQRFAEGMHVWPTSLDEHRRLQESPDLTERVLANVRPLPPPWVFREEQKSKHLPHYVAFLVGALGVALTFIMLCLTLVLAASGQTTGAGQHGRLIVPEVWHDVQLWLNSIPQDHARTLVTFVATVAFVVLVVAWFRTLAPRVGRDRQ